MLTKEEREARRKRWDTGRLIMVPAEDALVVLAELDAKDEAIALARQSIAEAEDHLRRAAEAQGGEAVPPESDDRYDAAHPESEHDGGLGSGDWMGPWEDRR